MQTTSEISGSLDSRSAFVWRQKIGSYIWLPVLVAISITAAVVRLVALDYNLPIDVGNDEYFYHIWAKSIRETGRPDADRGAGYPPGILYLLAADQIVAETILGSNLNIGIDYVVWGRTLCALFGVGNVILAASLGNILGKSNLAGLISAALVAAAPLMVYESRRAAANAPWVFFTLFTFLWLLIARDQKRIAYLYFGLAAAIASFLFKYQSGVILGLPFLFALICFRNNRPALLSHLVIWSVLLLGLLAWLIWDYKIFEVVNTPGSDTDSYMTDGRLIGFQSLTSNFALARGLVSSWIFWGAIATIGLAIYALTNRSLQMWMDAGGILTLALFGTLFFLLMSLFQPVAESKWLVFQAVEYILGSVGIIIGLRAISAIVALVVSNTKLLAFLSTVCITLLGGAFGFQQSQYWATVYNQNWSSPQSTRLMNLWFREHAPHGGRIVSEAQKILVRYLDEPALYHVGVVSSVFDETVESYRQRGYEYLLWNSLNSTPADSLADLEVRKQSLADQGAKEVWRVTGGEAFGPDIVIFRVDPLPQHEQYAWFTPAISFRGYDLIKDSFKPGDDLELMFYWMSAERVTANYIVFVHVISVETGELLVGKDEPTGNGYHPTFTWGGDMQFNRDRHKLTIPATTKAGGYVVRFGMYDSDTKTRVQISTPNNDPAGDMVVLQEIRIEGK